MLKSCWLAKNETKRDKWQVLKIETLVSHSETRQHDLIFFFQFEVRKKERAALTVTCSFICRRARLVKATSISRRQFASLRTKSPNLKESWGVNIQQVAFCPLKRYRCVQTLSKSGEHQWESESSPRWRLKKNNTFFIINNLLLRFWFEPCINWGELGFF